MIKKYLTFFIWTILGILFFALSFPGYFNSDGLPFMSFIALFPLYYLISKLSYKESIFFGFIYGSGTYLLFNYWLKSFDPVSFSVLPTIMGIYYILLFILSKYIFFNFKKLGYIPLTLTWLVYEVFKGENLIGYTYGTLAHSMYKTHLFTGIVDITGTYVLSIIIAFPSIFLAYLIHRGFNKFKPKDIYIPSIIYLMIILTSIVYTNTSKINYENSSILKTSLIQHNLDSWAAGNNKLYKETLDILIDLSTQAQLSNPDLVIWSETAFVPAIEWHKEYKVNRFRLNLVNEMEDFFDNYNTDYIIGANETVGFEDNEKLYYNSAYHYKGKTAVGKYRKNILVPFTERFPFPKLMPWLHTYIKKIGGKDLSPGTSIINFNVKDFSITPLICYEDTFSNHVREGIKQGGDLIINLTNDAWSTEDSCSKQHLSAALFRSIENRRSFVRVGNGGFSCIIDPNGKILKSLPILTKDQTTYEVPIFNEKITFYTNYGNIIEKSLLILFVLIFFIKLLSPLALLNKKRS